MGQKHSRLAPDTVSAPLSPHPVSDDLDIRLALVEGDEQEPATDLLRTPSARRDLDSGLSPAEAAKASRLRTQLRSFDAEIVQRLAHERHELLAVDSDEEVGARGGVE